ncbi:putative Calcium-dependent protein kinase 3 [Blattamonas nauphoetae]|uniref:Calcium-dependent protein kinase 3 n=1 Tax=Blattamonas nauphoetae TaxID=2049346 RepID=A0ABQ9WTY3_9EUKA|nr:putative Calcium-dependent protein kinase 3 [Blattamonas nauphoetae]
MDNGKLHDTISDEAWILLETEFCNANSLQDTLDHFGKLSEATTRQLMFQFFTGLDLLHSQHMIHRDIKPDNILLHNINPQNEKLVNCLVKIADFGLSRRLDSRNLAQTICGTPLYMAPELLFQIEDYTATVDIWSGGVMLYELVSGKPPYVPNNPLALIRMISVPPPRPPNISDQLWDLIQMMLSPQAAARPSTTEVLQHPWFQGATFPEGIKRRMDDLSDLAAPARKDGEGKTDSGEQRRRERETKMAEREAERRAKDEERRKNQERKQREEEERKRIQIENKRREEENKRLAEEEKRKRKAEQEKAKRELEQRRQDEKDLPLILQQIAEMEEREARERQRRRQQQEDEENRQREALRAQEQARAAEESATKRRRELEHKLAEAMNQATNLAAVQDLVRQLQNEADDMSAQEIEEIYAANQARMSQWMRQKKEKEANRIGRLFPFRFSSSPPPPSFPHPPSQQQQTADQPPPKQRQTADQPPPKQRQTADQPPPKQQQISDRPPIQTHLSMPVQTQPVLAFQQGRIVSPADTPPRAQTEPARGTPLLKTINGQRVFRRAVKKEEEEF